MTISFDYWNQIDPDTFLEGDRVNPARDWVGRTVHALVEKGCHTLIEVGPGPGFDYGTQFRSLVMDKRLEYTGFEGSHQLCARLQCLYPEALWQRRELLTLVSQSSDIVYEKAVLEHQPELEPSLSVFLGAARRFAIVVWYRPPADQATGNVSNGVYYRTFARSEVLARVTAAGFRIVEEMPFPNGNLAWLLERV